MDNIEKLFIQEVKSKKRIGSNIFSRVSTRKGGSNQALRTPYLYMSPKERRKLNGEVKVVYNMNDIITIEEFNKKSESEQRDLMTFWRKNYKTNEIKEKMGVYSGQFYRILDDLNIPRESYNKRVKGDSIELTDEEMQEYLTSDKFIDFDKYTLIDSLEQKSILLEAYAGRYSSINALVDEWEGSNASYLYNVRSNAKKRREKSQNVTDQIQSVSEKSVSEKSEQELINEAVALLTKLGYFEKDDSSKTADSNSLEENKHESNIDLQTNSFSFNLKGDFNAQTIKRRLELALEVLEDEEELLSLDISITNKS